MNVTVQRQELTRDIRERARDSDNRDNSAETGYQSNNDGVGFEWLREPENPIWLQGKIYR